MPWYRGASPLRHLEDIVVRQAPAEAGFRLPVQWVNRRSHDFRGFTGTVAAGVVRPDDEIAVWPSGRTSRVARIVTADGDLDAAGAGQEIGRASCRERVCQYV